MAAEQERFLDPVLVEDSKLIGGSPKHLPPPRGPTGTTLTFRVYAPPSLDKEIPKVDLVGAIGKIFEMPHIFTESSFYHCFVILFYRINIAFIF